MNRIKLILPQQTILPAFRTSAPPNKQEPYYENPIQQGEIKLIPAKHIMVIDRLELHLTPKLKGNKVDHDWIKLRTPEYGFYPISKTITLKKTKQTDKNYQNIFNIFIDGQEVGQLFTDSKIANGRNLVKVKFNNRVFYTDCWVTYYHAITAAFGLVINNIKYAEIAMDTTQDIFNLYKFYFLNSEICAHEGFNPSFKQVRKTRVQALNSLAQFVIGGGDKAASMYQKNPDILAKGKGYITDYYNLNGLDTNKPIDRVELRLKAKAIKRYNIQIEDLFTHAGLEAIFVSQMQDTLSFYNLNATYHDANRNKKCERVDIIDFTAFTTTAMRPTVPTPTPAPETCTRGFKMAFKVIVEKHLIDNNANAFNSALGFINNPATALAPTATANRIEYLKLTHRILKDFNHPPTAAILSRMGTLPDKLFLNS